MNVVVSDELVIHEVTISDTINYSVVLSDSNFIVLSDDDIMDVIISDGACC